MTAALISIHPKHVKNIIDGTKTIELRSRSMRLEKGDTLWIYSTKPIGAIVAAATVDFVSALDSKFIWENYSNNLCISESEYLEYCDDRSIMTLIGLKNVREPQNSLTLEEIRGLDSGFMPPQFYSKLTPEKKIYSTLKDASF